MNIGNLITNHTWLTDWRNWLTYFLLLSHKRHWVAKFSFQVWRFATSAPLGHMDGFYFGLKTTSPRFAWYSATSWVLRIPKKGPSTNVKSVTTKCVTNLATFPTFYFDFYLILYVRCTGRTFSNRLRLLQYIRIEWECNKDDKRMTKHTIHTWFHINHFTHSKISIISKYIPLYSKNLINILKSVCTQHYEKYFLTVCNKHNFPHTYRSFLS